MNEQLPPPTKGNLIHTKKTLALSSLGFELLDRKRNILAREMMLLIEQVKGLQSQISSKYAEAYRALQQANISLGVISEMSGCIPVENSIRITNRSVMGITLPTVHIDPPPMQLHYGLMSSNSRLDYAYQCFNELKTLTATLAEVENSVYRLAAAIRSTQRRANALENVVIPRYKRITRYISDSLEEKEREEFSRLKVIKKSKGKKEEKH